MLSISIGLMRLNDDPALFFLSIKTLVEGIVSRTQKLNQAANYPPVKSQL
jgi:hypothetical protein